MAFTSKQRLQQLSEHLQIATSDHDRFEEIPEIRQVAPDSVGLYV